MKTLSQYSHDQLQIVQPSIWKRMYELRAADTVVMTMTFPKLFSSLAVVEGFGETWELSKPSIWRSKLEIKKKGNHLPFAKYNPEKWGRGGTFELPNGERIEYVFKMWKGGNELLSRQKQKLMTIKQKSIWTSALNVTLESHSEILEKNPWIIMAVKYFITERRNNAAAAS